MRLCRFFFALAGLILATAMPVRAEPVSPAEAMRQTVLQFLERETRLLGKEVRITLPPRAIPSNARACATPEAFFPVTARAWGRTAVGIRCRNPAWTLFIPAKVEVFGDYLSAARPLAAGTVLTAADWKIVHGDLAAQPAGTLTASEQALGRSLRLPVLAGTPLTANHLLVRLCVQRGQTVKIVSRGKGFEVANEGVAINNAAEGQIVQIKLKEGRILQGTARQDGVVEVVN